MDRRIKSTCVALLAAAFISIVSGCSDIQFLDDLKEIAGLGTGSIHVMGGSGEISNGGSFAVGGMIAPVANPGLLCSFKIENRGIKDLNNVFITLDPASNFVEYQVSLPPSTSIPPGSSSDVTISFFPKSGGQRSLPVSVSSSDPDGSFTFYIGGKIPGWTGYTSLGTPFTNDVTVKGNYAYVASENFGVAVCDLNDKANPIHRKDIQIANSTVKSVKVYNDFLLVGTYPVATASPYPDNFYVMDIKTDPNNPQLKGSINLGLDKNIKDIAVNGPLIGVCTDMADFYSIFIDGYGFPGLKGSYAYTGFFGTGLAMNKDYAFVSYYNGTVSRLVRITVPQTGPPGYVDANNLITNCTKLTVRDSIVFLASNGADIEIIDTSNPALHITAGPGGGTAILMSYPKVFIGGVGKIIAYDITNPIAPSMQITLPQPSIDTSGISGLARSGEYLVATTTVGYLHTFLLPPGY